jgi:hypothetical protein
MPVRRVGTAGQVWNRNWEQYMAMTQPRDEQFPTEELRWSHRACEEGS